MLLWAKLVKILCSDRISPIYLPLNTKMANLLTNPHQQESVA